MTKKIKNLLSVMMAMALILMYLPKSESVFAATITQSLNFISAETTTGDGYSWNKENTTLTLDGLDMNVGDATAITLPADSTIIVNSGSTIESDKCCIKCLGNLTIQGSGKLVCNCDDSAIEASVADSYSDINIDGGYLKATTQNKWAHAIKAKNINVSNNGALFVDKYNYSTAQSGTTATINITDTGFVYNYYRINSGKYCEIYSGFDGEKTISDILTDTGLDVSKVIDLYIYKGTLNVSETPSYTIILKNAGTTVNNETSDAIDIYDYEISRGTTVSISAGESYTSVAPEDYNTLTPTENVMTSNGIAIEDNLVTNGKLVSYTNDSTHCLGNAMLYKITGLTVGKSYDFKLINGASATKASKFNILKALTGDIDSDSVSWVKPHNSDDLSPINTIYEATSSEISVMIYNNYDYATAPFTFTAQEKIYETISSSQNGDIYIKGTQNDDDSISLKYLLSGAEPTTWDNAKIIDETNPLYGTDTLNKDIYISLGEIQTDAWGDYPQLNLYVKDLDLGTGKIILENYDGYLDLKGNSIKTDSIEADNIFINAQSCEFKDATAKNLSFSDVPSAKLTGNINCDYFGFSCYGNHGENLYLTISPTAVVDCDKLLIDGNLTNEGKLTINGSEESKIYSDKIINKGTFINKADITVYNEYFFIKNTGLLINDGTITAGYEMDANYIYTNDCTLSDLTVNGGDLVPTFDRENGSYTMSVSEDIDSIKLTPTLNDATQTLKVNGEVVTSGSESQAIDLATGENIIKVTITKEDFTNTYKLIVTKGNPTPDTTPTYTPNPHDKTTTTDKIEDVAKDLEDGDKLTIKPTTENKSISGDVLKKIKGKDIDVKIEISDGIEWFFNGKDIPEDWDAKDINFEIDTKNSNIPADIINSATGKNKSILVNLSYSGEFGFEMTLTVHIGYLDEGEIASLYFYNPKTKELEFMQSSQISSNGDAKFDFAHASDYVILVADKNETVLDTTTSLNTQPCKCQ